MSRNRYRQHLKHGPEPKGEVRVLFPSGEKCPGGCGATLNPGDPVGRLMHRCDAWGKHQAQRGDRRTRSSVA
jgi:hypothetical protein